MFYVQPETPRWLFMQSREQEAIDFMVKYHGMLCYLHGQWPSLTDNLLSGNKDPKSEMVKLEIEEFRAGIDLNGTDKRWWDYTGIFKTHSSRWRIFMVITMGIFGAC